MHCFWRYDTKHNEIQLYSKWNATLSIMTLNIIVQHCLCCVLFMLTITYADCHLCWLSLMLTVTYADCHLCWLSLMLTVTYKPLILSVVMLSVVAPSISMKVETTYVTTYYSTIPRFFRGGNELNWWYVAFRWAGDVPR
jgi:hypothetical protein